jgi:cullin 1
LEKTPASKSINLEDSFSINETFTSQLKKVKLPLPALEEFFSKEKVIEDRSIAIEAAIVRIMKSRKQLEHNALVQEVITQLQTFKPHPKVNKDWVDL